MTDKMQPRDRIIPFYFVAFFVFLAIIYITMATIAIRTQTGVFAKHPYEQGLAYNKVVKASEMQNMLGWNGEINYTAETKNAGKIIFTLKDKSGGLIIADSVLASIKRPTQGGMDFSLALKMVKPGYFEATANFPLAGLWELRIYAKQGENNYQQSKRIVLE